MEELRFKPKYNIVNVYFGIVFSLISGVFLLGFGIIKLNLVSLFFSGLLIFAFVSSLYTYPREVILDSHSVIVKRFFLPDVIYSLYEITKIRLLKGRIDFSNGKIYYGSMLGYFPLLKRIFQRMKQLNISINLDEGVEYDITSLINSFDD